MGLLDIIPGVSEGKVVASGVTGLAIGATVNSIFSKRKRKKAIIEIKNKHAKELAEQKEKTAKSQKELHAIKKQNAKEENERNAKKQKEENEQEQREINKIAIMTQLAFSDGAFCEKEQLFIYKYIIFNPDVRSEKKLRLLRDLFTVKKTKEFFKIYEKHFSSDAIGTTDSELKEFSSTLIELMRVDGKIDKKELSYLKKVFKSCGLPKPNL